MALLDRLAKAQQIIGGYQSQLDYAREYEDKMRLVNSAEKRLESAEQRAMAAEERVAEMFPIEKAMSEFGLAGAALGIQSVMSQLESDAASRKAEAEVRALTGRIYREIGNMATAPEKISAAKFTGIRDEIVNLLESNPDAAPYLTSAVGMLSSVENRAMTTGSPAYKSMGDRLGSLKRGLLGGPSIYDPKLGWFKKQEMPSMGDRWEMIKWAFTKPEQRAKVEEGAFQTGTLGQMLMLGNPLVYGAFEQEEN